MDCDRYLICNRFPTPLEETLRPKYTYGTKIRTELKHFLIMEVNKNFFLHGIGIFGVPTYRPAYVRHILYGDDICNPDNQKIVLRSINQHISFNQQKSEVVRLFYDKSIQLFPNQKYLLFLDVNQYNTVRKVNGAKEICADDKIKFRFSTVHDIKSQTTAEYGNFPEFYYTKE